jgi:hypothetical protein
MSDEASRSTLYDVTWVHVFEEDTPAGSVFMRSDADIPLSRRPRLSFAVHEDGSAEIAIPGGDDRHRSRPARWVDDGAEIVVRADDGSHTLRVIEREADRLIVRRPAAAESR